MSSIEALEVAEVWETRGTSGEQEGHHNNKDVPDGNTDDLTEDLLLLEQTGLHSWVTLDNVGDWRLSSKGNSSESIHDQVDPKEHLSGHGRLREHKDTNKDAEDQTDVNSQLELEETGAVLEDISSPLDSSNSTGELVLGKDHLSGVLGGGASTAHSKSDLSLGKRISIIDTFTGNRDDSHEFHGLLTFLDGVFFGINFFHILVDTQEFESSD